MNWLDEIREIIADKMGQIECKKCGRRIALTKRTIKIYLREGWPKCCQETMALAQVKP